MNNFYFNECIPKDAEIHQLITLLQATIIQYNEVKTAFPEEVIGIVTEKAPHNTILNINGDTLGYCIENLEAKYKRVAYGLFNKYPVGDLLLVEDEDKLLEEDFSIIVGADKYSAINLAIARQNEGILFTLPIHSDLRKNKLSIIGNQSSGEISNLFGDDENTSFIKNEIQTELNAKLGNFDKLLATVGNNKFSDRFKNGFEKATKPVQDSIIEHFEIAKNRKGVTNFYSDDKLIKDVTPEKEVEIKIFELRIFEPVAFRVYFYETVETIYLALIEKKPPKKSQDGHIRSAKDIIKALRIIK